MHGGLSGAKSLFPNSRTCGRLLKLRAPPATRSCLAYDVSADAALCLHGRLGRNVRASGASVSMGGATLHRQATSWHGKVSAGGRFGVDGCSVALREERSLWGDGRCEGVEADVLVGDPAVLLPPPPALPEALLAVGLLSHSKTRSGTRCSFDVRHTAEAARGVVWSPLTSSTGTTRQRPTGNVRHTLDTRATTPVSTTSTKSPLPIALSALAAGVAAAAATAADDRRIRAADVRGVGQAAADDGGQGMNRVRRGGVASAAGVGAALSAAGAAFASAGGRLRLLCRAETPQPMYRGRW